VPVSVVTLICSTLWTIPRTSGPSRSVARSLLGGSARSPEATCQIDVALEPHPTTPHNRSPISAFPAPCHYPHAAVQLLLRVHFPCRFRAILPLQPRPHGSATAVARPSLVQRRSPSRGVNNCCHCETISLFSVSLHKIDARRFATPCSIWAFYLPRSSDGWQQRAPIGICGNRTGLNAQGHEIGCDWREANCCGNRRLSLLLRKSFWRTPQFHQDLCNL
jgi:hypothetical protein